MTGISFVDTTIHGTTFPATYVAPGILQYMGVSTTPGSTSGTLSGNQQSGIGGTDTYTLIAANCVPVGQESSDGIAGAFTAASTAVDIYIPIGFYPTKIEVNVGLTTSEVGFYQWMHGMGAYNIDSLVAADEAEFTTNAITVIADSAGYKGNVCIVKIPLALAVASQVCTFRIAK